MKTCIITACTGKYKAHLRSIDHLDVDGFIFGDVKDEMLQIDGNRWQRVKESYFWHTNPFLRAKYYKCFWHHIPILSKYDVVVWIDSTVQIKALPLWSLEKHDLAVYQHGFRNNTHAEINGTSDCRYTDYMQGLQEQRKLKNSDWLAITCFVLNKRCDKIIKMNEKWFSDILLYSPQDQVSFPTACEYTGVNVKLYRVKHKMESHTETKFYKKHEHLQGYKQYSKKT